MTIAIAGRIAGSRRLVRVALAAALVLGAPDLFAQTVDPAMAPTTDAAATAAGQQGGPIGFEADRVSYAYDPELVTASGNVVLRRGDQSVRADQVTWDRKTGRIVATGNIRLVDADGNQLYTDQVELTDELKAGAMQNLLIALRDGGRLAAMTGERGENGKIVLRRAAYSGCAVEDDNGCPKNPTWEVVASRVVYDAEQRVIRFSWARLKLFGLTLMPLPTLSVASDGRPINGLLIPDLQLTANNGLRISDTWYQRLGDNQDLALTGYLFTQALPMISAQYRALTDAGAFQITGYATRSQRISVTGAPLGGASATDFRGYFYANGRFQFSPEWSLTGSLRAASDRTFLRRYDINRDDRLRSTFELERVGDTSYFSFSGWATQTMRVADRQGLVPVALPVLDWRKRVADPLLGGQIEVQANSLAITRTGGQDTQRAFTRAQWDLSKLTPWGQEVTFTALARADAYHSAQNDTTNSFYPGLPGWQGRMIALGAIDVKWPLVGEWAGGTQVLTPRVQLVAAPPIRNLAVPNEDARAIDLEDSNLFALNRFPGYDRIEDGVRLTYGFDWQFQRPGWRVMTTLGQSLRVNDQSAIVPNGTGIAERVSDIVGRTEVRFRDLVKLNWRYRLDKDNLAVRRNEVDATVGDERTYAEVGYLRLNRNIVSVEDLLDREELRVAGRAAFAGRWSVFGSTVINLTNRQESPRNNSNGFQPLRTRLGVAYADDCLEFSVTWRRDYIATGDAGRGNTFQINVALRNLGAR